MPRKINLKLYDIDDCLFHSHPAYGTHVPIEKWLVETNEPFLSNQVQQIQQEEYDRVIIAYGTNRQDRMIDAWNPGGTCTPVLPIIQSYLERRVYCEVVLDPFLTADIYGSKPAGTSYVSILKEKFCDSHNEQHSLSVRDRVKISLIYAHAQRVCTLHPDADDIIIDYYDDDHRLLFEAYDFFYLYPDFLPDNVKLRLYRYHQPAALETDHANLLFQPYNFINGHFKALGYHVRGGVLEDYSTPCQYDVLHDNRIHGTGKHDHHYTWFVRYLAANFRLGWQVKIQSAEELATYHHENGYAHSRRENWEMIVQNSSITQLRHFRDVELPRLDMAEIRTTQQSAYTTATALYRAGLIPGEFVIDRHYKPGIRQFSCMPYIIGGVGITLLGAMGLFALSRSSLQDGAEFTGTSVQSFTGRY